EELDDLVVADGDDKDRERGGGRHVQGEMGMLAEREKRLLRTITGGGQAVGAEPYPGKKGNQDYMLAGPVAERIQRGTEQGCADRLHIRRPPHTVRRGARQAYPIAAAGFRRFPDFANQVRCRDAVASNARANSFRQSDGADWRPLAESNKGESHPRGL